MHDNRSLKVIYRCVHADLTDSQRSSFLLTRGLKTHIKDEFQQLLVYASGNPGVLVCGFCLFLSRGSKYRG